MQETHITPEQRQGSAGGISHSAHPERQSASVIIRDDSNGGIADGSQGGGTQGAGTHNGDDSANGQQPDGTITPIVDHGPHGGGDTAAADTAAQLAETGFDAAASWLLAVYGAAIAMGAALVVGLGRHRCSRLRGRR
ncbi:hypothetical protein ACFQ6V_31230 [Streptomyces roseifaciens]